MAEDNTDIFGSQKQVTGAKTLVTGAGVLVSIDTNRVWLCQNANVTYQRAVQQIYELGSETVYTQIGPASGTCALSYIVSTLDNGGPSAFASKAGCSDTGSTIVLGKGDKGCSAELQTQITCQGAVMTQIGWQAQAGQSAFTTSLQYTVTKVTDAAAK